jgi:hypothetical protein
MFLLPPGEHWPGADLNWNSDRWWDRPQALQAFREMCEEYLHHWVPEYPGGEGRGILICAGGKRLYTNAWVCINMLRHVGCDLPIQVWCREGEISGYMAKLLKPLDVEIVEGEEVRKEYPVRILHGWELKAFAILRSKFKEVLLLDADNVPVKNPLYLFETPEYFKTGTTFWPDYGRLERHRNAWKMMGLDYVDEPEFETGQILVDRQKCWRALCLSMYLNEYSDFTYNHIHGDKDTFHLAFRKAGHDYSMPSKGIHSLDATMCQHDFQGNRIFQHRNMDKWMLDKVNRKIHGFMYEEECRKFINVLKTKWRGEVATKVPGDGERTFSSK